MSEKRALQLASVASMIDQFIIPNIEILQSIGYKVDVIADFTNPGTISNERAESLKSKLKVMGVRIIDISIPRSLNPNLIFNSYKKVKKIINNESYSLIHCHSPIGGAICRYAARDVRKNGTKVIYTAHGFHFYKGAPLKNWLIYYPVEKICSYFTDVLITINQEDYTLAQKKMKAKQVNYIPGIGIDLTKFRKAVVDKSAKRKELGISEDATILFSVGELNENKNHEVVIQAIKDLDVYYLIAGKGDLQDHLQGVVNQLGITEKVKLLGYRTDIAELYHVADIYVLPSIREGLNVSIMEAMASGLPVVCGRIRGNIDLIDENGGAHFDSHDVVGCQNSIKSFLSVDTCTYGAYNAEKVKQFSIEVVNKLMTEVYISHSQKM